MIYSLTGTNYINLMKNYFTHKTYNIIGSIHYTAIITI